MIRDKLSLRVLCTIKKIYEDGTVELVDVIANDIVTTVGKNKAASHLANSSNAKTWFTHMALGTNTDAESTEDLALGAEIYRVALDGVAGDGDVTNSVYAVSETVFGRAIIQADSVGSGTITVGELGLLDASSTGNLICRQVPNVALEFSGTEKLDIEWGVIVN